MSLDFDVSIESEPEEDPVEDGDTVKDISALFHQHFTCSIQESTSLKRKFINYAAATSDFSKIAIGMANEMQVYDVTATGLIKNVAKGEKNIFEHPVSGVKFFKGDTNTVVASTSAGEIHMYDLRTYSRVHTFEGRFLVFITTRVHNLLINLSSVDDSELVVKPVSCFDINSNDRLICAGTDELNHNVYLLFFDIRERRLMGGFFESHQEEVTGKRL